MTVKEIIKKDKDSLIARAYVFAEQAHKGQKRASGEPYFAHALAAAENVASWNLDEESIAAALLHDTIENTTVTLETLKNEFGSEVAKIVDGTTKIGKIKYRGVELQVENLRKMFLALSEDIRVIIVKLADRLHNMQTLKYVPVQKQKRIALETTEIYAPIAYRLGMQKLSGELEDLAFPYIYPKEYEWLKKEVKVEYEKRESFIEKLRPLVKRELEDNGIAPLFIDARAKHYASLYKKLLRYDMDISKIYDLVALRIIVINIEDCYGSLGIIHKLWPPLPGRIKDYIAMPKPNGYRSLHTTVFCLGNTLEIQIRTQEMHDEAENGIAAHWAYEQSKGTKSYSERKAVVAQKKELLWVEQLRSWQKEFSNPEEFLQSLKIDFLKDRIFAITPKGEVIDLPAGATPVDFAYQIHSEIGNSCSGAKVNGKITPLEYQLRSGDIVEIITQKNKKPSESWLSFVKTSMAKSHIKSAIKTTRSLASLKKLPTQTEFRITADDRVGLLKDITSIISRSHVNIVSISTQQNAKFHTIKVICEIASKEKAEKLALKIKQMKGIKELNYKFI
ncbi:MAG TPA: RelA/SpoT family protein [Candidatus Paceibacterota bacterium]